MKLKSEFIKLKQTERLYDCSRPLVGLTGGIATGKSSACKILSQKGFAVIDADHLVKEIYKKEELIKFIQTQFPEAYINQSINFKILREIFFNNQKAKHEIESLIYQYIPEVFRETTRHLTEEKVLIYDVPLLFEKHLDSFFDLIVTVYIPKNEQIKRLMKRDNISLDLANIILKQQVEIEVKKNKSDAIIDNSQGIESLNHNVETFISKYFI